MIVGTARHIDHGKTVLAHALTFALTAGGGWRRTTA